MKKNNFGAFSKNRKHYLVIFRMSHFRNPFFIKIKTLSKKGLSFSQEFRKFLVGNLVSRDEKVGELWAIDALIFEVKCQIWSYREKVRHLYRNIEILSVQMNKEKMERDKDKYSHRAIAHSLLNRR